MEERARNVLKGFRTTVKASNLIEQIVDACNKYNLTLNSDVKVTETTVISFWIEQIAHNQQEHEERAEQLKKIILYALKDKQGNPAHKELINIVAQEAAARK